MKSTQRERSLTGLEVAVVGMACRFPGASGIDEYWRNLRDGVESIRSFSAEELAAAGVSRATLASPAYIRAGAVLEDIELFDARLFGYSPREAEVIDPQHRLFLECAWTALEHAGYDPEQHRGAIGVYAGASLNQYLLNVYSRPRNGDTPVDLQPLLGNDKDYLTTRVSYKLGLRGPSVGVQTACSSSLVAVHLASQALLSGDCDLALAGGVAVQVPQIAGYFFQESGIYSPDGRCRPFDAAAQGTVFGSGVGLVVLKRLDDALRDHDRVHAVLKGSAVNNDAAAKVGFTAPGAEGQVRVIRAAQLLAEVEPAAIGYVEAHGTATPLGDVVEIQALTDAFRRGTDRRGFCAIGSVKSNIGHLANAAGVAGLIKAVLALQHRQIPPSLHFERPNPNIDFPSTPFRVNASLADWPSGEEPRRAAVSSFGLGGTNAHAILEEAPAPLPSGPSRPVQLLLFSAATSAALDRTTRDLGGFLRESPGAETLADAAHTLRVGRRRLSHRRMLVCRDGAEAAAALLELDPARLVSAVEESRDRRVTFLFPGQGAQFPGMGEELYLHEPAFRQEVDRCAQILEPHLGLDLRRLLFPAEPEAGAVAETLAQTRFAQPALFTVEHALACLWREWGIEPDALFGHSLGEYVAACIAGVFSLEDALALVAARGRLMQELPPGAMLSVPLPEAEVLPLLGPLLALAAVNGPALSVVSGPAGEIDALARRLGDRGVETRRLHTSHAFHSAMMEPVLEPFGELVSRTERRPPRIPFLSNLTGTWITAQEATDLAYWVRHLRATVRCADGLRELLAAPQRILLEVGPGRALAGFARLQERGRAVSSLRHARDAGSDLEGVLAALGRLWLAGVKIDWRGFARRESRARLPLPTYPFERQRFWVEWRQDAVLLAEQGGDAIETDPAAWYWVPTWKPSASLPEEVRPASVLILGDESGVAAALAGRWRQAGARVATAAEREEDARALLEDLDRRGEFPEVVYELGPLAPGVGEGSLQRGFFRLLSLARALALTAGDRPVRVCVASTELHEVAPGEPVDPWKAPLLGPIRVVPLEHPRLTFRSIDVAPRLPGPGGVDEIAARLGAEGAAAAGESCVAYRGGRRWVLGYERVRLEPGASLAPLRERGTYLITGGFGGVGLALARWLFERAGARLVLLGRTRRDERVHELKALGAEVLAVAADVRDETALRAALREAEAAFGRIDGVIHAAGVPAGGLALLKMATAAVEVLAPKVQGAVALVRALEGRTFDFLAFCSSSLAATGEVGQVDYCGANAFLDAFAAHLVSTRGLRALSIGWPLWREVGMAVDVGAVRPAAKRVAHPFLQRCQQLGPEGAVCSGELAVAACWALDEHRLQGVPVLPGTALLELARAALQTQEGPRPVELRDTVFLAPLAVEGPAREVQVLLARDGDGYRFAVRSRAPEGSWSLHATGAASRLPEGEASRIAMEPLRGPGVREVRIEEKLAGSGQGAITWGPHWRCGGRLWAGEGEARAVLELPERFAADLDGFGLHPALLDVALACGLSLAAPGQYLPLSYGGVRVRGPLPRTVWVHLWRDPGEAREGEAAVTLQARVADEQGTVLAEVRDYVLRRLDGAAPGQPGAARPAARGLNAPDLPLHRTLAALAARAEAPADDPPHHGLSTAEGVEAFRRLLERPVAPHVVVCKQDLPRQILRVSRLSDGASGGAEETAAAPGKYQRPDLSTPYAAPVTETERACAAIWQELLGLAEVGLHDDFFELGGNSLLGIQLVSQMRARLAVELPLGQIFEAPTLAGLARRVEAARGKAGPAAAPPLGKVARRAEAPLSFAQESLWLLHRLQPESSAYNLPTAIRLAAGLDLPLLAGSLGEVFRRHEALRTTIVTRDGRPVQIASPAAGFSLPLVALDGLAPAVAEELAARLAAEEARRPFDLAGGRLCRLLLLRLAGGEHLLLVNVHHIVADGWSMALFVREVAALYAATARGEASPLPELPVQYADYAIWQREWLRGEVLDRQMEFWRQALGGAPPALDLPYDAGSPSVAGGQGARRWRRLPAEVAEAITALALREGATRFMVMLAAFQILLHRWTGQMDFVLGTVVANRNRAEVEGLIGCFMNFLPIRATAREEEEGRELLGRLRGFLIGSLPYQECPFEKIVEALNPERIAGRNPLYNVAFLLQNYPQDPVPTGQTAPLDTEARSPGAAPEPLALLETRSAVLDLRLVAEEAKDGVVLWCEFDRGLLAGETVERLLDAYVGVLERLTREPETALAGFRLPEPLERRGPVSAPAREAVSIAIAATFTAEPLAAPLDFWMREIDLPARIRFAPYNQVFQELLDPGSLLSGNRGGCNVVLLRVEDWLRYHQPPVQGDAEAAELARVQSELGRALRAAAAGGGAPCLVCICPPAPAPAGRASLLARMEEDLAASLRGVRGLGVVTSRELAELYPVAQPHDAHADAAGHIPYTPAFFAALAAVIARRIHAMVDIAETPCKVIAVDCDGTLWRGLCAEDGPLGIEIDPQRRALQEFLVRQHEAGVLICVCSKNEEADVAAVFAQRPDMPLGNRHIVGWRVNWRPKPENLRSLAAELKLGLDSFLFLDDSPVECAEMEAGCPEVISLQVPWGDATEMTRFLAHLWPLDRETVSDEDRVRTAMYRAEAQRERAQRQAPSLAEFLAGLALEVVVSPLGGEQMARAAQLTQRTNQFNCTTVRRSDAEIERFCARPGAGGLGIRVRDRFGDYGLVGVVLYKLAAEALRVDTLLLSCRVLGRGVEHRVLARLGELAAGRGLERVEIPFVPSSRNRPALDFLSSLGVAAGAGERALFSLPSALAAAATFRPGEAASGAAGPAAGEGGGPADGGAQRPPGGRRLRSSVYWRLAGELAGVEQQLAAMAARARRMRPDRRGLVPPRTATEELLAGIWSHLLAVEPVGAHDDFFALGGHSLTGTQMLSRVQEVLGVDLPLRRLFDAPTLAALAREIDGALRAGRGLEHPPFERVPRDRPLPLSYAQQRLWLIHQLDPQSPAYNMPHALRLRGPLAPQSLAWSLGELARRHETLRTTFHQPAEAHGEPVQVIAPWAPVPLPVVDLTAALPDERERLARELAAAEARQPFSLETGPLLRARLLRLAVDDHVVLLTLHHIVADGWSLGVLVGELSALYRSRCEGGGSPLPELAVQYADFAVWQRRLLDGEVLARELDVWTRRLAGEIPSLQVPAAGPAPDRWSGAGEQSAFLLPPELAGALRELGRREGATLFMTLAAAFRLLLYRETGQLDLLLGTEIANRTRTELEPLIGFFVNLLALRFDLRGNPTFRELLARARETTLEAYAHQDLPFEKLVEHLQPERQLGRFPLFQAVLVLQNASVPRLDLPGLTATLFDTGGETAKFDLLLMLWDTQDGGLGGSWTYSTDLYDRSLVERLSSDFVALCASAASRPDERLNALTGRPEPARGNLPVKTKSREKMSFSAFLEEEQEAVALSRESLVAAGPLAPSLSMPLVIAPAAEPVDLLAWAEKNRERIERDLASHGAILFRDFGVSASQDFERFAASLCSDLFGEYGDLPQEKSGEKIYRSTPYPPDKTILFHNESSQMHRWPMKQWFYCVQAARQGGETPIVDCRKLYGLLDPDVRDRFEKRGLMYIRNFTDGLDVSWQEFYRTTEKTAVEELCRRSGTRFEWTASGLRTSQLSPAVVRHPRTGEKVFFNQLQIFHPASLEPEVRRSMIDLLGADHLPRDVRYGDGEPIEDGLVAEITRLYWQTAVAFPWREGDILMVDNMLTAHARKPFVGPRKIVVAMGDMMSIEEVI